MGIDKIIRGGFFIGLLLLIVGVIKFWIIVTGTLILFFSGVASIMRADFLHRKRLQRLEEEVRNLKVEDLSDIKRRFLKDKSSEVKG